MQHARSASRPWRLLGALVLLSLLLSACGGGGSSRVTRDSAPSGYPDVSDTPDAVPRAEKFARANMRSYTVFGQRYHPLKDNRGFVQQGVASWYGKKFHGNKTANGETYDMFAMTAAHKRLPLPSYVQVRNLENGKVAVLRVNDRGPFHGNRIIDLSYAAASKLCVTRKGTALVEVRAIDPRNPEAVNQRPASRHVVSDSTRIYLQVGAFGDPRNARRLQSRLRDHLQREVRIQQAEGRNGTLHKVQIGPLASVKIADQVADRLEDIGIYQSQLLLR